MIKMINVFSRAITGSVFLFIAWFVGRFIPHAYTQHNTIAVIIGVAYVLCMLCAAFLVFMNLIDK
jgi:membrane protein DedA with SNARE-associated domain